jgi:hypothetical protein
VCVCWYLLGGVLGVSYPGPALLYLLKQNSDWFISQIFSAAVGRHIICWVRGEEEKLVSTANDWPGHSLLWNRKEIRKTAGRLIVSFQRTRRPRYANQRMPMNRVETSKHTHRELIHLLSFYVYMVMILFLPFQWMRARHLSLNTSRHRAHSTALSKGWTRVLVWLDPGLLLLLLKLH